MADENVFSPAEENNNAQKPNLEEVTVETLVGDEQKYSDANQLAKAYVSADYTIDQQKARIAELEARDKVLSDLVDQKNNTNSDNNSNKPDDLKDKQQKQQLDPPPENKEKVVNNNGDNDKNLDLSELVRQELEKANEQKSYTDNVDNVAETLKEQFGSVQSANEAVNKKAKELNVSVDWLMDAAGKSPTAFFATMGLSNDAKSTNTPASFSDNIIRPEGNRGKKDFKYFENLRKENSKAYYSSQVQREMFNARKELGDNFYN